MSLSLFNTLDVIEIMENAIERMRPPEDIRDKLDLGYRIENQSIILFVQSDDVDHQSGHCDHPQIKVVSG